MEAGQTEQSPHKARQPRRRTRAQSVECQRCGLYELCRVAGLESDSPSLLDKLVSRREEVATGTQLMRAGHTMDEIIAVRAGAFKASVKLAGDEEQVVSFVMPGELMGLEVLAGSQYPYTIEALVPSSICRFRLSRLHLLEHRMGEFQQQMIRALGYQNRIALGAPLMMGARTAEQRMALFLLGLSSRLSEHGFQGLHFRLPMSRHCIANYLGLAMETVSRVFKRFHARGLIAVRAREVSLVDVPQLREVAGISH